MLTSMMAVWNMFGADHDIWAVNTDFEYHEEQRLEDPEPLATGDEDRGTPATAEGLRRRRRCPGRPDGFRTHRRVRNGRPLTRTATRGRRHRDGMRIGIDATCWANRRGYGRFTRELLSAMFRESGPHEYHVFLDEASAAGFDVQAPSLQLHVVPLSAAATAAASADGYRSPTDLLRMTRAVSETELDAFFFPSVYTFFPLPLDLPAVVTIHDAIAERFPELTFANSRARWFWDAKVGLAVRQSRLVLTVSQFSRRDIALRLGIHDGRIRVTEEAPSDDYWPSSGAEVADAAARFGLEEDDRWFTYVGGFNPHKHVDVLVRAHGRVANAVERPPHLLLVGTIDGDVFHGERKQILDAIQDAGTEHLVHWTGFVDDADLRALHTGAAALVLASACEGFGLPAVEAAACGCPVIATVESPLPEVLAGGGLFIEPGRVAPLEAAMRHLLEDEPRRREYGRRAHESAHSLSWETGARLALSAIEEVAG